MFKKLLITSLIALSASSAFAALDQNQARKALTARISGEVGKNVVIKGSKVSIPNGTCEDYAISLFYTLQFERKLRADYPTDKKVLPFLKNTYKNLFTTLGKLDCPEALVKHAVNSAYQ